MFGNIREQMIRHNVPAMAGAAPQAAPTMGQPTGGVFGRPKRKTAQRVAGYLADALAGLAGQQGPYAAMLRDENALADQEAAYQRQRADQYADWQRRQEYEAAHQAPRVNDTVADYQFLLEKLGPEQAEKFLRNRADPPRYVQGPDGQFYPVQTAQVPTAPVGRLTPIEGGPASQAPGGFPR
jgi:hypothetical protein